MIKNRFMAISQMVSCCTTELVHLFY
jgi:hypothetical protein